MVSLLLLPTAVRQMMGAPGSSGSGMTADQKRKLLWGGKKAAVEEAPAPGVVFGANRWDAAEFSNASDKDKEKFLRLMVRR